MSVLMPVRNGALYIERAVASILTQTVTDLEVVIVDDGSTDATLAIVADTAARDPRVRLLRQEAAGISAALNRGLAEARAELIARLDADDMALPDRLEKQIAWLDAHADVAVLGGWLTSIDREDRKLRVHTYPTERVRATLAVGTAIAHPTVMMRKGLILQLGGYRSAYDTAEDYDLWLRVAEHADLANLPEVLTYYRLHSQQVTAREGIRQGKAAELARAAARARRYGPDPAGGGPGRTSPGSANAR